MDATERNISNLELNNIRSVADALEVMSRPATDILEERKKSVEEMMKDVDMPPNMHFVPSKRILLTELKKKGVKVSDYVTK